MEALDSSQRISQLAQTRGSSRRGFVLTKGDIDILGLVLDYRFLRREQVSALTRRHPKRLHRRLSRMEQRGYLTTIRYPQQKYIYGLGRAGVQELVDQGRAQPELLSERLRTHELAELFLRHEMMIVDIHVLLSLACNNHPIRLSSWREGTELHDSVLADDRKGISRLPVRPDAFFALLDSRRPDGANHAHYFLEADRSTTAHTRFQDKLRAYWAYIETGRHQKKLGIRKFRVLTVTLTDVRARNLSTLAESTLPERAWKYFVFTPLGRLSASTTPFGEPLCYCPRSSNGELEALIPDPGGLSNRPVVV